MTGVKPRYYRVKEVAALLALSQWEVRRLVEAGTLHSVPIGESGRYYRVTAASVDDYTAFLEKRA